MNMTSVLDLFFVVVFIVALLLFNVNEFLEGSKKKQTHTKQQSNHNDTAATKKNIINY